MVVEVGFQLQFASTQLGEVGIRFKAPKWLKSADRSFALHIEYYHQAALSQLSPSKWELAITSAYTCMRGTRD